MIGYQLMVMSMDGNLDGGQQISPEEVLQDFMVSPTHMRMEMHMFEVMYAPTDDLTLMGMVPYIRQSMDHLTRRGTSFATDSEGARRRLSVRALHLLPATKPPNTHRRWCLAPHRLYRRTGRYSNGPRLQTALSQCS